MIAMIRIAIAAAAFEAIEAKFCRWELWPTRSGRPRGDNPRRCSRVPRLSRTSAQILTAVRSAVGC
jgi:hypothetical protein